MGEVCLMHGIVRGFDPTRLTHRGLFDRQAFVDYLKQRSTRFVPLAAALNDDPDADALTIDDATYASAEAAIVARELGHAVTLFVNPGYIAENREYYSCLLSAILDSVPARRVQWEQKDYDFTRPLQRAALRCRFKSRLQALADDEQRFAALRTLAEQLGADDASLPPHLRTITCDDVSSLIVAGVNIQNHGWTHAQMSRLSAGAQRDEISRGREWLETTFGLSIDAYAVPFGTPQPEPSLRETLRETWYCALHRWPSGFIAPGIWNRVSLNLSEFRWNASAFA